MTILYAASGGDDEGDLSSKQQIKINGLPKLIIIHVQETYYCIYACIGHTIFA
jgi:hypothetical protein